MSKKNILLNVIMAGYIIGLFVFYLKAAFHIKGWVTAYYIWDKTFGAGFIFWYFLYRSIENQRSVLTPIVLFSFIRFLWEIPSAIYNISASNSGLVAFLFITLTITTSILMFKPNGSIVKFLEKNIP